MEEHARSADRAAGGGLTHVDVSACLEISNEGVQVCCCWEQLSQDPARCMWEEQNRLRSMSKVSANTGLGHGISEGRCWLSWLLAGRHLCQVLHLWVDEIRRDMSALDWVHLQDRPWPASTSKMQTSHPCESGRDSGEKGRHHTSVCAVAHARWHPVQPAKASKLA